MIDFRSLEVSPVRLTLDGWHLVTLDSGQRHVNADDAADGYNRRRAECAEACELLGIESLREATAELASELPEPLARRALHVITENERVREMENALRAGDLDRVGALLNESHASLRDCFEISTPAVERTVARLLSAGARGARIVGGGFGGHVLGLLPPARACPTARSRSRRRPARGCCDVSARRIEVGRQQRAQRDPAPVQPALEGGRANPGDGRRFVGAQPFEVAQDHGSAQCGRQLRQRGIDGLAELTLERSGVGLVIGTVGDRGDWILPVGIGGHRGGRRRLRRRWASLNAIR